MSDEWSDDTERLILLRVERLLVRLLTELVAIRYAIEKLPH
jgi:hypothetical protein